MAPKGFGKSFLHVRKFVSASLSAVLLFGTVQPIFASQTSLVFDNSTATSSSNTNVYAFTGGNYLTAGKFDKSKSDFSLLRWRGAGNGWGIDAGNEKGNDKLEVNSDEAIAFDVGTATKSAFFHIKHDKDNEHQYENFQFKAYDGSGSQVAVTVDLDSHDQAKTRVGITSSSAFKYVVMVGSDDGLNILEDGGSVSGCSGGSLFGNVTKYGYSSLAPVSSGSLNLSGATLAPFAGSQNVPIDWGIQTVSSDKQRIDQNELAVLDFGQQSIQVSAYVKDLSASSYGTGLAIKAKAFASDKTPISGVTVTKTVSATPVAGSVKVNVTASAAFRYLAIYSDVAGNEFSVYDTIDIFDNSCGSMTADYGVKNDSAHYNRVGDRLTYSVTLYNPGNIPLSGVSVSADVPAEYDSFTVASKPAGSSDASLPSGGAHSKGLLQITGISLPVSGSGKITYTVVANASATDSSVVPTAFTVSNANEGVLGSSGTVAVTFGNPVLNSKVLLTDKNGGDLEPGDCVDNRIEVGNSGSVAAGLSRFLIFYGSGQVLTPSSFVFATGTLDGSVPGSAIRSHSISDDSENSRVSFDIGQLPANATEILSFETCVKARYSGNVFTSLEATATGNVVTTAASDAFLVHAAPVANPDDVTTMANTPIDIDVLDNDLLIDAGTLSVESVGTPSHGTASISGTLVNYVPGENYVGSDSFTYVLTDGVKTATGTVTVGIGVAIPTANADSGTTFRGVPVTIDVLANDSDSASAQLSVVGVVQASSGTVAHTATGTTYSPNPGFVGTDSYQYVVSNGTLTDTGTVTVTVVNRPPSAVADTGSVRRNASVDVDVLANDSDPDSDPLSVASVGEASNGVVSFTSTGVSYAPNLGFVGTDSFTYSLTDGVDADTGTVTVTVVNDPPVALADSGTTSHSSQLLVPVLANDSDPNGDPLSVTGVSLASTGAAEASGTGILYSPYPGFVGTATFSYLVSDGADTATGTVTVTVTNEAPVAQADTGTTARNSAIDFPVLDNDSDADGDRLEVVSVTQPSHGSGSFTSTGVTYVPALDYSGQDSFQYAVTDGFETATGTVTVTVLASPRTPVAVADSGSTLHGVPLVVPVLDNDSDPDGLELSLTGVTDPTHGSAELSGTGVRYSPNPGFVGTDSFSYRLTNRTKYATGAVTVTVTNDAPVALADSGTVHWTSSVRIPVLANDSDPNEDPLSVTGVAAPQHGTATFTSTGVTYSASGSWTGEDVFEYAVTDGFDVSTGTVTVTVTNAPPVAEADSGTTLHGVRVRLPALANDSDPDGDPVSLVSVNQPLHGASTYTSTGVSYLPDADFVGTDSFTYRISDGVASATGTVTVTVTNDAPVALADSGVVKTGSGLFLPVLANDSDPNEDALSVTGVTAPEHGTTTFTSTGVSYQAHPSWTGSESFEYAVTDGFDVSTGTVTVTVVAPPAVPPLAFQTGSDSGTGSSPTYELAYSTGNTVELYSECSASGETLTILNPNITSGSVSYLCQSSGPVSIPIVMTGGIEGTDQDFSIKKTDVYGNESQPTVRTATMDDRDGIPANVEDAGPNGGDANGDGVKDSRQTNVAGIVNPTVQKHNALEITGTGAATCRYIDRFSHATEASLSAQDGDYDYPMGLWDFTFECTQTGATAKVTVILDKSYDPATWRFRKFDPVRQAYSDITDRVWYETLSVSGATYTTANYYVTDGGEFDSDGVANGYIHDPAGPTFANPPQRSGGGSSGGGGISSSLPTVVANPPVIKVPEPPKVPVSAPEKKVGYDRILRMAKNLAESLKRSAQSAATLANPDWKGIRLPKILPKTGKSLPGAKKNPNVVTGVDENDFRFAGTGNTDLAMWKSAVPEADRDRDEYLVVPSVGLVIPVAEVTDAKDRAKMVSGKEIDVNRYLKSGALKYPETSPGSYGDNGNVVVFGHSSYFRNDDGRYKTRFQRIIGVEEGAEIWAYRKNASGGYDRFVYRVEKSYEAKPTETSVLKPTEDSVLTLFTCTPIGTAASRWVLRAKFVGSDKPSSDPKAAYASKFSATDRKLANQALRAYLAASVSAKKSVLPTVYAALEAADAKRGTKAKECFLFLLSETLR